MGVLVDMINEVVKKKEEELLKEKRGKITYAAKKVTREIHTEIIRNWFECYNGQSVIDASEYSFQSASKINGSSIKVTTKFHTSIDLYKEKPKAEEWRMRPWRKETGVPGKVWVLLILQMQHGIIGLPDHYYHGIFYPAPRHKEPLEQAIQSKANWGEFESRVMNNI